MRARTTREENVAGPPAAGGPTGPQTAGTPAGGRPVPQAADPATNRPEGAGPPRLRTADRQQLLSPMTIDDLLEANHPARAVWRFALGLDLTTLYDRIRSRGPSAGRPAIDPRVLVALWLYATLAGVRSANALADLCVHHDVYFWLAGGLAVNAHTLSDFRVQDGDFLERLLKHSVEVLRRQGLVDLSRVAQDGMRVRAGAGAASFRRRETLEKLLQQAQDTVARLQPEPDVAADPDVVQEVRTQEQEREPSAQQQGAARRHARERVERIRQALRRMPAMEAKKRKAGTKKGRKKEQARVSTTDPEATVMKMADGGYRPAYNLQFSTSCRDQVIVGVGVVTEGTDQGQLAPMLDQIEERFGERPQEALVDGGFASHDDIEQVQRAAGSCKVYAPVPRPKKEGVDRHEPKRTDSAAVAEWRRRMGSAEAKEIYKGRGATAECVNAQAHNRGLVQLAVRGLEKVRAIALWFATVHNMARSFVLQPQPLPTG